LYREVTQEFPQTKMSNIIPDLDRSHSRGAICGMLVVDIHRGCGMNNRRSLCFHSDLVRVSFY
jgi:hypothetical protein